MTIAEVISTCPAPVANATGVANGLAWLAVAEAFALDAKPEDLCNRHTIINLSEIYFTNIKSDSTDYTAINDQLYKIKDLYSAIVTVG